MKFILIFDKNLNVLSKNRFGIIWIEIAEDKHNINTIIRNIDAIIGLSVLGFIEDKIVFLGSPCSSHEHSSDDEVEGFKLILNLWLHFEQVTSNFLQLLGASTTNSCSHFGQVVLPFINRFTTERYTYLVKNISIIFNSYKNPTTSYLYNISLFR